MKKNKIYKLCNPVCLQGSIEKQNYFEGWYYKCVDASNNYSCAFIPGISTSTSKYKRHAFIQFIDNSNALPLYIPFSIKSFSYSDEPFVLNISNCVFSDSKMIINIDHNDCKIKGKIVFGDFTDIDRNIKMPTIMGYYRYIPFMECFHSIISLSHSLKGYLKINDRTIDFNNGTGYLEKDFGTSFPKRWIWVHSNTFNVKDTCLMCSIASIPFISKTFTGLICILYAAGKEYRFATYLKAKITKLLCSKNNLHIELSQGNYKLEIRSMCSDNNILIAPKNGNMNRKIIESMSAKIKVKLLKDDYVIFESITHNGCVEYN
ncbi:tocopherol cyclase family protein [Vallitalea guaymasensis]|uniref:tocopherol cyclase family protein n=1 Tax=Vallitalea guaymasensis TaxID=1185412 RepID=UPI0023567D46|nr:tocopherol cyclase family protein [Vallitalea guaymasensis]